MPLSVYTQRIILLYINKKYNLAILTLPPHSPPSILVTPQTGFLDVLDDFKNFLRT